MKKLSFKEFVRQEKGLQVFTYDLVSNPSFGNAYIEYTDYLIANINETISYTQYIAENIDGVNDYSNYLIDNMEKSISYTEYLSGSFDGDYIRRKIYARRKKIINRLLK